MHYGLTERHWAGASAEHQHCNLSLTGKKVQENARIYANIGHGTSYKLAPAG
ncbi:MAG: hypothetical protein FWC94_04925 [Bacteroidales bacterium]|nr:hypothetical protein [Bacteroidales bacterium]